jgi:prolyl-tRNA editing enzyme YbaK/EbsC (Cys-tRNA(Pro) deacylase)
MMTDNLSASAQRVQQALAAFNLDYQVMELSASTRTAKEAATAVGCKVGQIVKSLVFKTDHTLVPVLVIASGVNRVDVKILGELLGKKVDKADAEFVRQKTGFAIGGVPPVGFSTPIKTFIDEDLLHYDFVWAAAGTPHAVFRLVPADLEKMTGGKVAAIKSQTRNPH